MSQITANFEGAFHKTAVMVRLPKATKHVLTQWATDTVMMLKKSAAAMQKSGRKTGALARGVGMQATPSEGLYKILVGTGVGGTQSVKYASIQDQGGVIKAKKKYLTIPLGSTKGLIRNFPGGFFIRSKAGNVLYCQSVGSKRNPKLKPLFLLREQVTLPATHWFSGITDARAKDLTELMKQGNILKVAEGMAAGSNV